MSTFYLQQFISSVENQMSTSFAPMIYLERLFTPVNVRRDVASCGAASLGCSFVNVGPGGKDIVWSGKHMGGLRYVFIA